MLNKIMHKGDEFFPDLNGKKLKHANNVKAVKIKVNFDSNPSIDSYLFTETMPAGSYHLYLLPDDFDNDNYGFRMYDLMSYIQNGGVLSRLLNHLYQCFNSLFRKWVRVC